MKKMSYDRIGNVHIRENGKKRSIFDKVNEIKQDLKTILPEVEGEKLIHMLSKIRTYLYHKKKAKKPKWFWKYERKLRGNS